MKIFVHGFYQYIPDGEILNWEDGYEYLTLGGVYASHSTGGKFVFRRNNIFSVSCMMDDLFGLDDKTGTYYCWSAIWLQVFYVIVFLGSIIFLILGLKKSKKKDE